MRVPSHNRELPDLPAIWDEEAMPVSFPTSFTTLWPGNFPGPRRIPLNRPDVDEGSRGALSGDGSLRSHRRPTWSALPDVTNPAPPRIPDLPARC